MTKRMDVFLKKIKGGAYDREERHGAYRCDLFKAFALESCSDELKDSLWRMAVSWVFPRVSDGNWEAAEWETEYWKEDILLAMKVIVGVMNLQRISREESLENSDAMMNLVLASIGNLTRFIADPSQGCPL